MAILIDLTDEGLQRTSGSFLNPAGSFTFCTWAMFPTEVTTGYRILNLLGDQTYSGAYIRTGPFFADDTDWQLRAKNAGGTTEATDHIVYQTPTIWQHIAVVYTSGTTTLDLYYNGELQDSVVLDLSASTFAREQIGFDVSPSSHGNIGVGYYRSWSAALTADEIRTEMGSASAVKATGLFCDTPLTSPADLTDDSGNGRDWTAVGTLATVTGPLLGDASITNTSAADAEEIPALPTTIARSVRDATTNTVWFRMSYAATAANVGVFAFGTLSGYKAQLSVYDGLANALANTLYLGLATGATQLPVSFPAYPGHVYYLKVEPTSAASNPAVLVLSALALDQADAGVGSIAINDDTDGFALAILSSSTGRPLRVAPSFPAGEDGHILPNGKLLVHGIGPISGEGLYAYSSTLEQLAGPINVGFDARRITSDRSSTFYVGADTGAFPEVTTVNSTTWTQGPTTWTLTNALGNGLLALGVSLDNTVLYYLTSNQSIERWDLSGNTGLSVLVGPLGGGYSPIISVFGLGDILVMPDDTVVVGYQDGISTKILHYSAAGATINEWDYGDPVNHIAHDGANSTTIWAWFFDVADITRSIFRKIDITDGSVVQETPAVVQYSEGFYSGSSQPDPTARFGHSSSCPFWVTTAALTGDDGDDGGGGGGGGGAGDFSVIDQIIRRLRRAPHLNSENTRIFYPGLEIDLDRGIGLVTGQGEDPIIMCRISRDGGRTWSSEMRMRAGAMGRYLTRAQLHRLGYARDAVFEITVSDPNNWRIVNAWLTPDPVRGEF